MPSKGGRDCPSLVHTAKRQTVPRLAGEGVGAHKVILKRWLGGMTANGQSFPGLVRKPNPPLIQTEQQATTVHSHSLRPIPWSPGNCLTPYRHFSGSTGTVTTTEIFSQHAAVSQSKSIEEFSSHKVHSPVAWHRENRQREPQNNCWWCFQADLIPHHYGVHASASLT